MPNLTWPQKRAALRTAVAKAMKLDRPTATVLADGTLENTAAEAVQWLGERGYHRMTRDIWADMRVVSIVETSQGETRYEPVLGATPGDTFLYPHYYVDLQVNVDVLVSSDDQTDADAVGMAASRLRTRLRRPDIQKILADGEWGLVSISGTEVADYAEDGRLTSSAVVSLTLNTFDVDAPELEGPYAEDGPWIGAAEIDGVVSEGVDGDIAVNVDVDAR